MSLHAYHATYAFDCLNSVPEMLPDLLRATEIGSRKSFYEGNSIDNGVSAIGKILKFEKCRSFVVRVIDTANPGHMEPKLLISRTL